MLPNDLREPGEIGGLPWECAREFRVLRALPFECNESRDDMPDVFGIGSAGNGWLARYLTCDGSAFGGVDVSFEHILEYFEVVPVN